MTEKIFYLDNPVIALNGLVTDKIKYSKEETIRFINKKKKLDERKRKKEESPIKNKKRKKNIKLENEKIINLSEDSDSNNSEKNNSKIKSPKKLNNKNKKLSRSYNNNSSEEDISNNLSYEPKKRKNVEKNNKIKAQKEEKQKKIQKNNKNEKNEKNNNKNENINKKGNNKNENNNMKGINNIILDEDDDDIEEIVETNNDIKNMLSDKNKNNSKKKDTINIKYKNVEKSDNYNEIKQNCKDYNCTYIPLFNSSDLKSIIELNSAVLQLFKKIKNEEKANIIISEQKQEINLINALNELLTKKKDNKEIKNELFQKLKPDNNNILRYFPTQYSGINNFGFMNINAYNNEDTIHFITPLFKDSTNNYILKFRKYILNLSSFTSNINNNDNDNNIYHIIIPKDNITKIDINLNEEMNLNVLLGKINCEYYFYKQIPGELLIVEPGSIHLSYYKKTNNYKQDKNYLLMFWNKMNINSFHDYTTLKDNCKKEKYKYFPILTMLFNLINKKMKYLSGDCIKIIREIYNDIDSYENINKYIKEINDNNISFHNLFLNNVDICSICQQEIFNFYVYYKEKEENDIFKCKNKNGCFLCINCAYKKKYFSIPKSVIFFKYPKNELESFVNKISANINKNKNDIKIDNNEENDEIISKCFDLNNRKDDCLNIDEFILKIDGPLKTIDINYQNNNNYPNMKNIKVDKYLSFLENDKLNNIIYIDPLSKNNFKNNINENDIYEIINSKDFSFKDNINLNKEKSGIRNINKINNEESGIRRINKINIKEFGNINNNIYSLPFERINKFENNRNDIMNNNKINNPFINKENKENKESSQSKKKKKKGETVSDLILGGLF